VLAWCAAVVHAAAVQACKQRSESVSGVTKTTQDNSMVVQHACLGGKQSSDNMLLTLESGSCMCSGWLQDKTAVSTVVNLFFQVAEHN
jgi:hypothetical protein